MVNYQNNGQPNSNGENQRLDDQERRIQHLEEGQREIYDLLLKIHSNIQGDSESGVRGIGNRVVDLEDKTHKMERFMYRQKVAYWIIGGLFTTAATVLGLLMRAVII